MVLTKIRSKSAEVLSSGTFIPFDGGPTEISIGSGKDKLKLVISFSESKDKKEPHSLSSNPDKNTLNLQLVNFNSSLGIGNKKPLKIGGIDDEELFLQLRVYDHAESDKLVHYTIYRSKD